MIQNVHGPGSCDVITELHELSLSKKVAIYPALFVTPPEIAMVIKSLSVIGLEITAILFDEKLAEAKPVPDLHTKLREENFRFVDLAAIRQFQDVHPDVEIIILSHHIPPKQDVVCAALEREGINCRLYHFFDIPYSVTIDGKLRVLNDVEYLRSWPPVLQQLVGPYVTSEEIERYKNGKYPYNNTSKGTYYCLENHRSLLTRIYNGFIECGEFTPIEGAEKKTVTFLGDSRIFSPSLPSRLNIPSLLQERFNEEKINCEVKNFCALANSLQNMFEQIKSMEIGKDDIILCGTTQLGTYFKFRSIAPISNQPEDSEEVIRIKFLLMKEIRQYCAEKGATLLFLYLPTLEHMPNMTPLEREIAASYGLDYTPNNSHHKLLRLCLANDIPVMDLSEELIHCPRTARFIDERHFSPEAQNLIVGALFDYLNDLLLRDAPAYNDREFLDESLEVLQRFVQKILTSHIDEKEEYVQYLRSLAATRSGTAGFIVMNCNPFTLGHMYLVETARSQVDHLYILVVPEENPHFAYKDRLEMAKRACAKFDNVVFLLPGTAYANNAQFPEYLQREKNPNAIVDLSKDIYTFCYQIAPALHVTKRFVGTEPKDFVTAQLNTQFKAALPDAGIELIEFPRKELNDRPVSASDVRRLLKEKQYDAVREIVPETTYNYLRNELGL